MNNTPYVVTLDNIGLDYREQNILKDISLNVRHGEILTIIGPNGAGKSSLIKIIAGLIGSSSGAVWRQPLLRMGYVPQKLAMGSRLPIKVSRFLSLAQSKKESYKSALEQVGAAHLWSKQMHTLSGGELQRVLLARAISRSPQLLLLDEPLQGVDIAGQVALYRLIGDIQNAIHCSIVMVSHDLHLVMAQTDQVICLNKHICCAGQPESVSQHPEYTRLFGMQSSKDIAIYAHHHDHHHDLHGEAITCSDKCQHD